MRKKLSQIIPFALIFLVIGIFIGISLTSLAPPITTTTTTTTANNKVCCHSFGFGSEMKRCCDKYEWTTADGCKVPEGMVGGGKEIVDNSYCVSATTTTTITDCSIMNPNYCNTNDDCVCACPNFIGNKDYAEHCVNTTTGWCQMNLCFFAPGEGLVCINHECQIGKK